MTEWCMAHPWLTFWIIIVALTVVDNIANNVLRVICAKKINGISELKEEGDDNG